MERSEEMDDGRGLAVGDAAASGGAEVDAEGAPLPPGLGDHAIGAAEALFAGLPERLTAAEYNFAHFRTTHLVADVQRTLADRGVAPGERAPDFTLPCAGGGWLRLDNLRGMPILLHFGSST